MSIDYLFVFLFCPKMYPVALIVSDRIPDDVINYIYEHNLYRELDLTTGKDKTNAAEAGPSGS